MRHILIILSIFILFLPIISCGNDNKESTTNCETNTTDTASTEQMGGSMQEVELSLCKVVTTFAGLGSSGSVNGTGTSASFNLPYGITTDGTNLYVADDGNNLIRQIE